MAERRVRLRVSSPDREKGGIVISRKNISPPNALGIWFKTHNIFKRANENGTLLSVPR